MAAHRYWRVNITFTGSYVSMGEIELRGSVGGADLTGSGTASASSAEAGNEASKAVDNNNTTAWATYPNGPPQWWAYDFGAGNDQDVAEVAIRARQSYPQEAPRTFYIQYSDNGTDWTTACPVWFQTTWGELEQKTFAVEEPFSPYDLTSDTSHSPFVVSSSSEWTDCWSYEAFDNSGSFWSGSGGGVDWLALDIGEGNAKILQKYVLAVSSDDQETQAPKDWTMEGSNNGSTWDTLDTVTEQTAWSDWEQRTFTCDVQTTAYRYFRINITDNNGNETFTQIAELYLYEGAAPVPQRLAMFLR